MRNPRVVLFLIIVLAVYGLINLYVLRRGWQSLAGAPAVRLVFGVILVLLVLSYPAGRFLAGLGRNPFTTAFIRAGALYMALMLYLLLAVLVIDAFRLVNAFVPFFPRSWAAAPHRIGLILFAVTAAAVILVVAGGTFNAAHARLRELSFTIEKKAGDREGLRVAMASDIHLSTAGARSRLEKLVERINALGPDIILLPGDIVDESMTAEEEGRLTSIFRGLRAPLGVFSVLGNHEYYSGLEESLAFLRASGITVLQDESVRVGEAFTLVGRKDPTALRRGQERLPLAAILRAGNVDPRLPLILLDHQPIKLGEAMEAGIDLELSGHTHAGQLFPLNLVNKRIYEQNWGALRKGKTQYYVSCGYGTWGPPVRTGSVPEVLLIRIAFRGTP